MIQTTESITAVIQQDNELLISEMLKDLIKTHRETIGERQKKLEQRYKLKDLPIQNRKPAPYEKVDRRTAADFFGDIVDLKTGYMGNEVSIGLDKQSYTVDGQLQEAAYEKDEQFINDFSTENNSADINSEIIRQAATMGIGYRLMYVAEGNIVRLKNIPPYEVIYVYDRALDDPQVVFRYYTSTLKEYGAEEKTITHVEWYDEKEIRFYVDDGYMNFRIDESEGGRVSHLFTGIPIIPFPNNEIRYAEPEKAIPIMDAYDAIISSTTNEIEQLRLAYMFARGAGLTIDRTLLQNLEQTGIFPLPEGGELGFVEKNIAIEAVTQFLEKLEELIYKFSKSVNMSKDYGGDMRVIGWQVAIMPLEQSSKVTERKFQRALRDQYKLFTEYWRTYRNTDIDLNAIHYTFTRNFPKDLLGEAQILQILMGLISKKTALAQMSFIDDVEQELKEIEAEREMYPDVDDERFNGADEESEQTSTE